MQLSVVVANPSNMQKCTAGGAGGWADYSGLVWYYKFDDATDAHTGGYDLTEINSPAYVAGQVGNCVDLENADSDRLSHAADSAWDFAEGQEWTCVFWLNTETNQIQRILELGAINMMIQLAADGDVLVYRDGAQVITTTATYGTGTWRMFSCGYDGTNDWIRLNKDSRLEEAGTDGAAFSNKALKIGGQTWGQRLDGKLDEMSFWKRSLSDVELDDIYDGNGPY
jgi:hypothetical protein